MAEAGWVSVEKRVSQLRDLLSAVDDLIAGLRRERRYLEAVPELEAYAARARGAIAGGVAQATLNELAYAVPRLFWLHKDWEPPCEPDDTGQLREAAWFQRLSPLEKRVQELAFDLRVVGQYGR